MALKFEIDNLDGLEEGVKALYAKNEKSGKFRLQVDGLDPADELKGALQKEREEVKEAKRKLKEIEDGKAEAERLAAEKNGEYENLYKSTKTESERAKAELSQLRAAITDKELSSEAHKLASSLTRDTARATLLAKEARAFLSHSDTGVVIKNADGTAWDADKLSAHLKASYPFLVDGSQASGGGAAGGTGGAGSVDISKLTPVQRINQARAGKI